MSPPGAMPAIPCSPWMRTHSSWGWGGTAEGGAAGAGAADDDGGGAVAALPCEQAGVRKETNR